MIIQDIYSRYNYSIIYSIVYNIYILYIQYICLHIHMTRSEQACSLTCLPCKTPQGQRRPLTILFPTFTSSIHPTTAKGRCSYKGRTILIMSLYQHDICCYSYFCYGNNRDKNNIISLCKQGIQDLPCLRFYDLAANMYTLISASISVRS